MTTPKLPEHIGGFQHLEPDVVTAEGDILVVDGKPCGFVTALCGLTVGRVEEMSQCRVYRKYPCPRQGGDRPLTAEEIACQQQRADHQMSEPNVPLVIAPTHKGPSRPLTQEEVAAIHDQKPGVIVARALGCNALPTDAKARKGIPIATGFVDYFPKTIAAVARLSQIGNEQHNPGAPLHWDRSKSGDEADAFMRHFLQRNELDSDGVPHVVKCAWRANAMAQKYLERNPWP